MKGMILFNRTLSFCLFLLSLSTLIAFENIANASTERGGVVLLQRRPATTAPKTNETTVKHEADQAQVATTKTSSSKTISTDSQNTENPVVQTRPIEQAIQTTKTIKTTSVSTSVDDKAAEKKLEKGLEILRKQWSESNFTYPLKGGQEILEKFEETVISPLKGISKGTGISFEEILQKHLSAEESLLYDSYLLLKAKIAKQKEIDDRTCMAYSTAGENYLFDKAYIKLMADAFAAAKELESRNSRTRSADIQDARDFNITLITEPHVLIGDNVVPISINSNKDAVANFLGFPMAASKEKMVEKRVGSFFNTFGEVDVAVIDENGEVHLEKGNHIIKGIFVKKPKNIADARKMIEQRKEELALQKEKREKELLFASEQINKNAALAGAAAGGHIELVAQLLKDKRIDPSKEHAIKSKDKSGLRVIRVIEDNFALEMAARKGDKKIVEMLLADERINDKSAAIAFAVMGGQRELVGQLLANKALDPTFDDNFAIQEAVKYSSTDGLKLLLADSRVDPSASNNLVIQLALDSYNHNEKTRLLLVHPKVTGEAVLQLAIENVEMKNFLASLVSDFNTRTLPTTDLSKIDITTIKAIAKVGLGDKEAFSKLYNFYLSIIKNKKSDFYPLLEEMLALSPELSRMVIEKYNSDKKNAIISSSSSSTLKVDTSLEINQVDLDSLASFHLSSSYTNLLKLVSSLITPAATSAPASTTASTSASSAGECASRKTSDQGLPDIPIVDLEAVAKKCKEQEK
ncbi:MAG: ankyrin repeat domain-containing protein [Oligoflexia bacterium]|nr:ankyrin repeat domain-containing protein [Oligoflexia bacterium]